jgi:biopolymer transport protein ExbB/TolQ
MVRKSLSRVLAFHALALLVPSAGIGTALLATAIGIGTALICLVVYNAFLARVERLSDETKLALLEMSNQNT